MYLQKKQTTIRTYDQAAEAMAAKFNAIGARRDDIHAALRHVQKVNPRVVELGCGNGRDAQVILEYTNDYLGMDASGELLNLAQELLPRARFVHADFESFVFPMGIDTVFAFASLLHAPCDLLAEVLSRAHSALNPAGVVFLSLKHGEGEVTKTDAFGTRTYYLYAPADIHPMVKGRFTVIEERVYELQDQTWFDAILQKR